jgi:5'-3' exonuclease
LDEAGEFHNWMCRFRCPALIALPVCKPLQPLANLLSALPPTLRGWMCKSFKKITKNKNISGFDFRLPINQAIENKPGEAF